MTEILPPPTNPMAVARELLTDYQEAGRTTLLSWRGGWMHWQRSHWIEIEENELRSQIYKRLEHAEYITTDKDDNHKFVPWAPNKFKVANLIDAVRALTFLAESVDAPSWLNDTLVQTPEIVACQNGLLHVGARELIGLTLAISTVCRSHSTMTRTRRRRSAG
jgi:putative DNA primase/helicase